MVRSDTKSETVRLKVCRICVCPDRQRSKATTNPKLSQRKLPDAAAIRCSYKPSHTPYHGACLKHGGSLIKTPPLLSDVFPEATSQEDLFKSRILFPLLRLSVLIQAVSARRISLPTNPIPVLTRVLNEVRFDKIWSFPRSDQLEQPSHVARSCVPVPSLANWRNFGACKDSKEATTTKTEPAGAVRSTGAQLPLPPRFDHFQGSGIECSGSRCETLHIVPQDASHEGAVTNDSVQCSAAAPSSTQQCRESSPPHPETA